MSDEASVARRPVHPSMLPRLQQEVLLVVMQGLTNQQIALRLGTTSGMVGIQIGQIIRRFGLSRRAEITRWADEQRLAHQLDVASRQP